MANSYYNVSGAPATGSSGRSLTIRAEFAAIAAGFDKLPTITGNSGRAVIVNPSGTGLILTTGALLLAGGLATTGTFDTTLAQQASVTLTLPAVNGTLATLAGAETLTNKTIDSGELSGTFTGSPTLDNGSGIDLAVGGQLSLGSRIAPDADAIISTPNGSNILLNPQGTGNVQVLSAFVVTGEASVGNNNPVTGSALGLAFKSNTALSGTITSSGNRVNQIVVNSDVMDASGIPGGQIVATLEIDHNFGGAGFAGGRSGILVSMVQTGAVSGTPGVFASPIVAMQPSVALNHSFGGSGTTDTTAAGFASAINPLLWFQSGYTNGGGGSGMEVDIQGDSGSSFMDQVGVLIVRLPGDAVQAARDNAAIGIANGYTQTSSKGWKTAIAIGTQGGFFPLDPTGSVMAAFTGSGTLNAAHGIDLSAITFSTDAFKSTNFMVTGSGAIAIGTSGAPSYSLDSFAAASSPVALRLTGQAGASSDNVQLRFAGQKDGELWAIGCDIAGNAATKDFEFYNFGSALTNVKITSGGFLGISSTGGFIPAYRLDVSGDANVSGVFRVSTNQVVGARITGWGSSSNGSRGAVNGSTATLSQVAAGLAQLLADLTTHGLLGA